MGKPVPAKPGRAWLNTLGQDAVSGGTETSKYPEEKKSTEIPLVVANERGSAQTGLA
jgi:hypothetical protein